MSSKKNYVVSFNSNSNTNACRFFSNLAYSLLKNIPHPKNLEWKILRSVKGNPKKMWKFCFTQCIYNLDVTTVDNILNNLNVALIDGDPVIPIILASYINMWIKHDIFFQM